MNKTELAVKMVKDSGFKKGDALKVIEEFIEVVSGELKKEDAKVTLVGFGTFKTITKKRKKGVNPRTGAKIIIPKKRVLKFIPGKQLKLLCGGPHGPGKDPYDDEDQEYGPEADPYDDEDQDFKKRTISKQGA